jgi:hypothetical protein
MKAFLTLSSLIVGGILVPQMSQASTPVEVQVPVENVYTPKGFDSNDRAEVVISGYLPNLCHRSPFSKVRKVGKSIQVELSSLYYEPNNPFCAQMIVPFLETVQVGVLEKGDYEVIVNGGTQDKQRSVLTITEAKQNSVDDYVYAGVEYVDKSAADSTVTLKGYNPSDCYAFDEVVSVSNNKDTYAVLPKMKQVYSFCPMKMIPFSYQYRVPKDLEEKKVLLHVRSMNGKSVNSVYDFNQSNPNDDNRPE